METPLLHSLAPPTGASPPSQSHAPPQLIFPVSASAFVPPQGETQALALAPSSPAGAEENVMHKNHLIQYCQKSGLPMPVFQVVNEGVPHVPRFKCTVWVYGKSFTSPNIFRQKKAAEQDAAKLALEHLTPEDKAGGKRNTNSISSSFDLRKLVSQDKTLCKMIVNEFTVKMNLGKCTYETVQLKKNSLPMFVSSLVLNGTRYQGDPGKNKKEAEQLTAHAAMLSLLGDPSYAASLSEVIMSKLNLYAAFTNVKDFQNNFSVINKEFKTTTLDNNMPVQLNQQVTALEQSSSAVIVNDNLPATVNYKAETEEKDGSQVQADKEGGSGVLINEKMPAVVNSHGKTVEQVGPGVLVDKQGGSGVLTNDSETLLTVASFRAPLTVTPKPCLETQPSLHELKSLHSELSTSQQISLPIESAPSATPLGPDSVWSSSKKRRWNKKNKANKRLQTENNSDSTDVPQVPLSEPPRVR